MSQRLLSSGSEALDDDELLELVLSLVMPSQDARPIAHSLVMRYGSFANIITAPAHELQNLKVMRGVAPVMLKAVQAAALRLVRADVIDRPLLNNWNRLMDYLHAELARERVEQVHVLFLDTRNRLLAHEALAHGTINHTPIYPREVLRRALELGASALILVHNHPSGDPTPSPDDVATTQEILKAAKLFDIILHDHVIIGSDSWTSLKRDGWF